MYEKYNHKCMDCYAVMQGVPNSLHDKLVAAIAAQGLLQGFKLTRQQPSDEQNGYIEIRDGVCMIHFYEKTKQTPDYNVIAKPAMKLDLPNLEALKFEASVKI